MKQTIATAIAGVPSGEVVKYQPSLNRKSFLKKYWVAITIVIVTISVAVAIYAYMTRHTDVVHEGAEDSIELIPMKDSLVDSCSDAISSPPLGGSAVDTSDPQQKNALPDLLYENGNQAQPKAKSPKVAFDRDSAHPWGEENRITLANGESQVAMKTTIIQGPPPYKYELTDRLILKANYSTTAGFVFTRKGDTFYMTDNSKQRFMLLKGKGELPLVPMNLPQK